MSIAQQYIEMMGKMGVPDATLSALAPRVGLAVSQAQAKDALGVHGIIGGSTIAPNEQAHGGTAPRTAQPQQGALLS